MKTNVNLTSEQAAQIALTLMNKYSSLRAIKESCYKSLSSQYGKEGAKDIIKLCQMAINKSVDNKVAGAWNNVSAENILRAAYKDLTKGGKSGEFGKLSKIVSQSYSDVMDFVSRCYPYTIGGKPARKVTYVDSTKGSECIFDVYDYLEVTPENAVKILKAAHRNQGRSAKKVIIRGVGVCTTTEVLRNHEVARYKIATDEETGIMIKGDKIEIDYTLPVIRTEEYITLRDANKALLAEAE